MIKSLMTARRFAPLFWCQFCSALNDNFLKNALVTMILFGFGTALAPLSKTTAALLIPLAGVVFIAPYFFLSALGGELADKYDKAHIAERVKLWEIPVAIVAGAGFYLHSIPLLFLALAGFGILGALFGPVKYGILPETLTPQELSSGNALVEGATFIAILLGTIGGSIAVAQTQSPEALVLCIVALAVACWSFARMIPAHGPAAPGLAITPNPLTSTFALLRELKSDPRIITGGHVTSWFWLVGAVAMSLLPVLIKEQLNANQAVYTASLATFTIGIAVGSLLAARVSHDRPNLALVAPAAALMALFSAALGVIAWAVQPTPDTLGLWQFAGSLRGLATFASLFGLALAGGLYIVPSFAAVQLWSPADKRARVIASVNVLNALYMTLSGAALAVLQALALPLWSLFALLAVGTLFVWASIIRPWARHDVV
jgi:acyl-[acyl-carrier-protein]-phospholipid O-acyltransferase/long-chain-fatty-acid--[acyl-carrier-protein] ligase